MTRLLAATRHEAILRRLDEARSATVEELGARLDVSRETIRRDLKLLAGQGLLEVVHGGALRRERREAPFAERRMANREAKAAIATLAAGLVADGMSVLLDSGTTTEYVARALVQAGRRRLTIHTISVEAARICTALPEGRVRLIGGDFDGDDDATAGPEMQRVLARLSVDIAFVGVGAIDEQGELTDYTRLAATTRGLMLRAAEHPYLVGDGSKLGRRLASTVPEEERAAGLLTDRTPPAAVAAGLAAKGVAVRVGVV